MNGGNCDDDSTYSRARALNSHGALLSTSFHDHFLGLCEFKPTLLNKVLPIGSDGKESACQCRRCGRPGFDPWDGKIPWRRKWQPAPVFLPGESHGQRSLVGYSPWLQRVGHDSATKHAHTYTQMQMCSCQQAGWKL